MHQWPDQLLPFDPLRDHRVFAIPLFSVVLLNWAHGANWSLWLFLDSDSRSALTAASYGSWAVCADFCSDEFFVAVASDSDS